MITIRDLQEAIAECHGVRDPDARTCIKLAAYYTILDHMADTSIEGYSKDSGEATESTIANYGTSDFLQNIKGKDPEKVFGLIDELVSTVEIFDPRLYAAFMRKVVTL